MAQFANITEGLRFRVVLKPGVAIGPGKANLLEAIRDTEFRPVNRMLDGAPVRGAETTVEIDETRFASIGDAHLFGVVLDELLATYCSINSFHELKVRLHPSKIEFRWDPRNGHHRIL